MLDIIFIILVFLVFLIGANNYESFENDTTQEDVMYQSNQVNALTGGLDENITGTTTGISTMVSDITGEIDKLTEKKEWIEGCVGSVRHCGKEPYMGRCSRRPCSRVPCGTSCSGSGWRRRCSTKYCTRCRTIYYGCTKWRNKCTPSYPVWKCSSKPSGYKSPPGFPSGWRR